MLTQIKAALVAFIIFALSGCYEFPPPEVVNKRTRRR